jgi:vacuolar-type H+-ATPase subunit D/Vma8
LDTQTEKIVQSLERERDALIRKFLEFTDLAERYNEKAYEVSCQIESINFALREAEDSGIIDAGRNCGRDGRHVSHVPRPPLEEEESEGAFE